VSIHSNTSFLRPSVQMLCKKAPGVAQFLGEEIAKQLKEGGKTNDDEEPETSSARPQNRKRQSDPLYRPPKSFKATERVDKIAESSRGEIAAADITIGDRDKVPDSETGRGSASSEVIAQASTKTFSNFNNPPFSLEGLPDFQPPSTVQDRPSAFLARKPEQEPAISSTAPIHGRNGGIGTSSSHSMQPADGPPQAHATTASDARNPMDEIYMPTKSIDLEEPDGLVHAASSFGSEQRQIKQEVIRSTPEAQVALHKQQSPQTEEIPRVDGSALPTFRLESPSPSPLVESFTFRDFLCEMINVIAPMSRSQDEVPTGAHSAILRSLQPSIHIMSKDTEAAESSTIWTATDPTDWSGHMWIDFLEAGEGRSQKTIIFNMIGYMGASAWFDTQLALFAAPLTKRRQPRKRVATPFLDSLLKDQEAQDEEPRKRRKLALGSAEENHSTSYISKDVAFYRRRRIIDRVTKGVNYAPWFQRLA
jgi:hypothetical protein